MTGLAAQLAGIPITQTPRGGPDSGFTGVTIGDPSDPLDGFSAGQDDLGAHGQPGQFQGMGDLLEDSDEDVFRDTDDLIRRQELLAINRWNVDEYFKCVVDGYPWATLMHDTTRDVYDFELPYGVDSLSIQPIPNKNLDLVNKTSEQILVDFPDADAEPIDDSEAAEAAADAGNRFLAYDAGEQGTNDAVLYDDRVKSALVCASAFIEYWVDPSGGGYVPLQIEAHPRAASPQQPLVGPDGMPTTDLIERYVTAPINPDGTAGDGSQFTDDPSQAAPQWQKKICASKWQREHIRTVPEHLPVDQADEVIVLGHCTIGQAKRRWQSVAQMAPEDVSALCDWTPTRYLVLLPPFQRARWKLTDGKQKNKSGSSDERIMFYYRRYIKARPDYPKGADVVMSGIDGGLILDKQLLSVEVEVPAKGPARQGQTTKETRCREIPVVQVTPRGDPYGQDPTGKAYMTLFVGATENNAVLSQGYAELVNKVLHTPFVTTATSPIEGWQVEAARSSGDFLQVIDMGQAPKQLDPPKEPGGFFEMYSLSDEAINSIASRERAASGADNSRERSGKALQIAVSQNNIGNSSMLTAVNNSYARGCRIKLELAMAEYTTTQQIAFVGEDGANQMMDLHATDFALIGKVNVKAGTGTGLTQDAKVEYLGNLKAEGFLSDSEASDAARPSFAKRLGLPPNPFEQYVSRCIDTWVNGPPSAEWVTQYQGWLAAEQQYEHAQALFAQQFAAFTQYQQNAAIAAGGPPSPALGPEGQNARATDDYQQAMLAMRTAQLIGQQSGVDPSVMPVQPSPPQIPKPWVPFAARPNDTEPQIAAIWMRRLSRVMSSVDYERYGPEWSDVLSRQYSTVRQAAAIGNTTPTAGPPGAAHGAGRPATPATQPTQPSQPTSPPPALPAGARAA